MRAKCTRMQLSEDGHCVITLETHAPVPPGASAQDRAAILNTYFADHGGAYEASVSTRGKTESVVVTRTRDADGGKSSITPLVGKVVQLSPVAAPKAAAKPAGGSAPTPSSAPPARPSRGKK